MERTGVGKMAMRTQGTFQPEGGWLCVRDTPAKHNDLSKDKLVVLILTWREVERA
jgi:hypothetical protein